MIPIIAACCLAIALAQPAPQPDPQSTGEPAEREPAFRVLVFTKTAGFRHGSIEPGAAALAAIGDQHGFRSIRTEAAGVFTDDSLADYRVVVFLNTTGDILNPDQEAAMERFIRAGNGFVGIHSAADTEYGWKWYGGLVGAYFRSHPPVQPAEIDVIDREHPSTAHLPERWPRVDEWYDFRSRPADTVRILMNLDESTYTGGVMGNPHPIAWCHEYDGGRALYTAGGHTNESFAEPDFRRHLAGAIRWAAGLDGDAQP